MKILFISPRYEGGIGGHAFRVAEKLRENGFDVNLMHVPHIPIKNIKNPSFAFFGTFKSLFDKEKYDAVHAWNIPSAFIMKNIKAKKKILSVHGVYSDQVGIMHSKATSMAINLGESKILSWADKLTTDSRLVQQTYKEKYNLNFIYLAAPLDTSKFADIPYTQKKENQVAYIGRDSFEKGIDILRDIEQNINGEVVYCTNVKWAEAMKILKESCILIVPSRMESIPQTIKEAFYLKTPVIATKVGGIPELMKDLETGYLIEKGATQDLIDKINILLTDTNQSKEMGKSGKKFVTEKFSWDVISKKFLLTIKDYVT